MQQRTIRKPVAIDGIGLHSGKPTRVVLSPAPPDTGVVFHVGSEVIPGAVESVIDSRFATTVGKNGVRIQTVEHLMAATSGLGIDNLDVRVEGAEIPAADGSAKPFVTLLASAGRTEQGAKRRKVVVPYTIRVGTDTRWLVIVPAEKLRISYTLDNDHPAIGTQTLTWIPT
jgi:UDP-3-O-[3-hydroxymyristoyl] N-acetylglucosamine deacetylase